jgi:hypothetical protein
MSDPSVPEPDTTDEPFSGMAADAPFDVDFGTMMARSQAGLIQQVGLAYQANEDLRQKCEILGKGKYALAAKPSE